MNSVRLGRDVGSHIRRGHPWIYRQAIKGDPGVASGTLVKVRDRDGKPVAIGLYDADSPIAVRVLAPASAGTVDAAWVQGMVRAAVARRFAGPGIDSDAMRLVHGEADGLPGLVIDVYQRTAVARFDGGAAEVYWQGQLSAIVKGCAEGGITLEGVWSRPVRRTGSEGRLLWGKAPGGPVTIREGPLSFEVDVVHGHKTGFFLDQRDNRRLVGQYAAGADVLDLFAYTGGFSVAAGVGGASSVNSVDAAAPAVEVARRNLAQNQVAGQALCGDVFDVLARAAGDGKRWDLVVCDPPSFAPRAAARDKALEAYRKLNRMALDVLAPGGLLATASCSSHIRADDLVAAVADAGSRARRTTRIVARRGAAADHPASPAFPEGDYLTFLLVAT